MKIGITGASGFLGSEIIHEAKRRRIQVVAFSRSPDREIPGASEVRSIADTENIDLTGLDGLVHLAGEPIVGLWTEEKKRRIRDSRIDLTQDLVEAISRIQRGKRPAVLVSASAIGFYGNRGDEWLDEEADVGFGFLAEVCRDWETAAFAAEKLGVRVVAPRIGLVMGRDGLLKRLRLPFKIGLGGRLGSGRQWMSWIHVKDLARLFVECAANAQVSGRVNCVTPNPVTNNDFTLTYASVLGRKALFPVPGFLLKRLPGGMGGLFLDSQRVDPIVSKAFGFDFQFPDLREALLEIEFPPESSSR
ncbi:MAG: TIGR01777 family oxidoreductase [Verrucomicrobiota bacterium]